MIRIGQIGMAHDHAEGKMPGLRSHPEIFDVVAVAEDDPQNRERFGGKECYRGLPVLTSAEKIADVLRRESEAGHPSRAADDAGRGSARHPSARRKRRKSRIDVRSRRDRTPAARAERRLSE